MNTRPRTETEQPAPPVIRLAVILAAGRGARLGNRGELSPKGFMRLGQKSIIEESILRLLSVGIERVVIVTGHLAEHYEGLQERYRQIVQLVHNPHFAESGTLYSLHCARDCVDEPFLLLESDLVYERLALTTCLDSPCDNVLLMAGLSNTSDECFVETRNGQLLGISKNRASLGAEVRGEMVGICKISRSLFGTLLEIARPRFQTTRHLNYEVDGLVPELHDVPVECVLVEDLVWCEIDDETHYTRARDEIYPLVQRGDERAGVRNSRGLPPNISQFASVGFFGERDLIIRHMHDFFATANQHKLQACIMFGTLLGKLRHDDFIPWDDDVDIVVFDYDAFLKHTVPDLQRLGYTVEPDIRDGERMGCRIFREDSAEVPGRPRLRFPWIGIWEHKVLEDGSAVLPPEDVRYRLEDFLPIDHTDLLGVTVGIPHNPSRILDTYLGSDDWMEMCQLPYRDHRRGGELTGFADDKFELQVVLDYLDSEHPRSNREAGANDAE